MVWLPAVVGAIVSVSFTFYQDYVTAKVVVGLAVIANVFAALVARGVGELQKLESADHELKAQRREVESLQKFLDWMHAELFGKNTDTRITILVATGDEQDPVLRPVMRPTVFLPIKSRTELSIDCNSGIDENIEGVAGKAYCGNYPVDVAIKADPNDPDQLAEYARASYLTVERAQALERKALYYMARPIENLTGRHLGVLVVDNARAPKILTHGSEAACGRAEAQVQLFLSWIILRMRSIPDTMWGNS